MVGVRHELLVVLLVEEGAASVSRPLLLGMLMVPSRLVSRFGVLLATSLFDLLAYASLFTML